MVIDGELMAVLMVMGAAFSSCNPRVNFKKHNYRCVFENNLEKDTYVRSGTGKVDFRVEMTCKLPKVGAVDHKQDD